MRQQHRAAAQRAFIFDLDGVLWDSWSAHDAAFREVLAPLGIADFDYARYAGMRTDQVITEELRRNEQPAPPGLVERLTREKQAAARRRLTEHPPVLPATPTVLAIAGRLGRVGLATSASQGTLDAFIAASGCAHHFDAIALGSEVAQAKPAPDLYLLVASRLNVAADRCIVVEDAPSGVRAARTAGMRVIGIALHVGAQALQECGATWVLAGLDQLEPWLLEMGHDPE